MENNKHNPLLVLRLESFIRAIPAGQLPAAFCTWNVTRSRSEHVGQLLSAQEECWEHSKVPGARGCTSTKGKRKRSHRRLLKTQTLGVTADSNPAPGTNTELRCTAAVEVWQNEKQASLLLETTPPVLPGAEGTDLGILTCSA